MFSIMRGRTEVMRYALKPPRSELSRKRFSAMAQSGDDGRRPGRPVIGVVLPRLSVALRIALSRTEPARGFDLAASIPHALGRRHAKCHQSSSLSN